MTCKGVEIPVTAQFQDFPWKEQLKGEINSISFRVLL